MKKIISLVIAVLLITAVLVSCASGSTAPGNSETVGQPSVPMPSSAPQAPPGDEEQSDKGGALIPNTTSSSLSGDKIIYNYSATVETTKFDETLKSVETLLSKYGAFIENSYISGNSYGKTSYRTANYTIRVPVANFRDITGSLTLLGNVINASTTSQNITAQFVDTESRLKALRTEESRLLSMLEKADTVADMISIESRLSDVRYQIESLTTTLKNWQNQVDYSTVTLYIAEVEELTTQVPAQRTYWEQIGDGVNDTLRGIGNFFKNLFMYIVVALPVLIILGVIAVAVLIIVRVSLKKKKPDNNQDSDKKE